MVEVGLPRSSSFCIITSILFLQGPTNSSIYWRLKLGYWHPCTTDRDIPGLTDGHSIPVQIASTVNGELRRGTNGSSSLVVARSRLPRLAISFLQFSSYRTTVECEYDGGRSRYISAQPVGIDYIIARQPLNREREVRNPSNSKP